MWYYSYPSTKEAENLPLYLYSIGLHDVQPLTVRLEGHRHDQFFYNTKGSGTLIVNRTKYDLPEKSGFFLPARSLTNTILTAMFGT